MRRLFVPALCLWAGLGLLAAWSVGGGDDSLNAHPVIGEDAPPPLPDRAARTAPPPLATPVAESPPVPPVAEASPPPGPSAADCDGSPSEGAHAAMLAVMRAEGSRRYVRTLVERTVTRSAGSPDRYLAEIDPDLARVLPAHRDSRRDGLPDAFNESLDRALAAIAEDGDRVGEILAAEAMGGALGLSQVWTTILGQLYAPMPPGFGITVARMLSEGPAAERGNALKMLADSFVRFGTATATLRAAVLAQLELGPEGFDRINLTAALVRLWEPDPVADAAILRAVAAADSASDVALRYIGGIGLQAADLERGLLDLARTAPPERRGAILTALARAGGPATLDATLSLLNSSDATERSWAVTALGGWPRPGDVFQVLGERFRSRTEADAPAALYSMARLDPHLQREDFVRLLTEAFTDDRIPVRAAACGAIGYLNRVREPVTSAFLGALRASEPRVVATAIWALGRGVPFEPREFYSDSWMRLVELAETADVAPAAEGEPALALHAAQLIGAYSRNYDVARATLRRLVIHGRPAVCAIALASLGALSNPTADDRATVRSVAETASAPLRQSAERILAQPAWSASGN